jgi:hypothetical protein
VAAPATEEGDERGVVRVPTAPIVMRKEGVRCLVRFSVLAVQRFAQYPHLFGCGAVRMRGGVQPVLRRDVHWSSGEHDGRVVEEIVMIESNKVVDGLSHEGVLFGREHEVIANANGDGFGEDNRIDE